MTNLPVRQRSMRRLNGQARSVRYLSKIIRARHSERGSFNPRRTLSESDVREILESVRWAPTAHNMQNFEVIVVDDQATLAAIGRVRAGTSAEFIRENSAQLSFSEEELTAKGTGLLASMFPPSWRNPGTEPAEAADLEHGFLDTTMRSCLLVLIVVYDTRRRAPASEGDFLGVMSLGCVLQNIWLMAEALGLGLQVMSVLSGEHVEDALHPILSIPDHLRIAFACRIGYPAAPTARYLRVRRELRRFTHRNVYGNPLQ
jgi:nitroreductase